MRVIDAFRIFAGFCLSVLIFTPPILLGALVPMKWRRYVFYLPWNIFSKLVCFIFRLQISTVGRQYIERGFERRHLFICNHQSALDIPILVSIFTIPFLTKRQNLWVPFVGLAGLMAGCVTVDRESPSDRRRVIRRIIDRIDRVTSLYIFPEGTRSRTGDVQARVFPAVLRAAWRDHIDVVPIALHGSYLVIGHRPQPDGFYPVHVQIGEVVKTSDFTTDKEFADYCWQRVIELHSATRKSLEAQLAPAKLVEESLQA